MRCTDHLPCSLRAPGCVTSPHLTSTEAQIAALRRVQCSAVDGRQVTFYWKGVAYGRVPGEADRLLFRVEGMNTRQCGRLANARSAVDFRLVSREILLYEDPSTGAVLRNWQNPWTGKTVEVIHVANDPVNGNYGVVGRDGKPANVGFTIMGDHWLLNTAIPLRYQNPLAGDYQQYVGGMYQATELFNFFGDAAELADPGVDSLRTAVGWERISPWLPWMEMGDRPGFLYFHTAGIKVRNWDELSAVMREEIERNFPAYKQPPPLDDARPNETSWTYFRKIIDARPAAAGERKR
jgi:hypothetical protein